MGRSGLIVIGSAIIPLSYFLTFSTSWAWAVILRLRWMMPMPPAWAMAIAVRASVTVSIAALTSGTLSLIERVRAVAMSASLGMKSDAAGISNTSSKVSPSGISVSGGSISTLL